MTSPGASPTIERDALLSAAPPVAAPLYLLAVAITGIAAGAWWVESPPGIGVVLVAVGAALVVLAGGGLELKGWTIVFGGLGLALVSTAVFRAAAWVVFPNLLFALVLAAFALRHPSDWSQSIASLLSPPFGALLAPAYLLRSAASTVRGADAGRLHPLIRGLALGGALVALFWALFASADAAFLELSKRLMPDWDLGLLPPRAAVFVFVVIVTTGFHLGLLKGLPPFLQHPVARLGLESRWALRKGEWVTALAMVDLLFTVFVAIQALVLFAGHDHILRTADLTYAEYARQGFFQLLGSVALTLPILVVGWTRSKLSSNKDLVLLRTLLGIMCALTAVILISALKRLALYEDALGFTRLRLTAHAFGLWLAALLILLLIAGATRKTGWLIRGATCITACGLLIFTGLNPDAMIARRNLSRYQQVGKVDLAYLSGLSADAVPELRKLPPSTRAGTLTGLRHELTMDEPWSSFNLAREHARRALGIK